MILKQKIKKLGEEGWEWVGYDNSTSGTYIIFKKKFHKIIRYILINF